MAWEKLNGEDIYEVRARVQVAMERAHNECKPTLLEISTYRYYGHSVADANHKKYRTKEEIERYEREHDPIIIMRDKLIKDGYLTEDEAKAIDKEAFAEAEASGVFAEESPFPDPSEIFDDVYWEVDNNTEAGSTGRHFFND